MRATTLTIAFLLLAMPAHAYNKLSDTCGEIQWSADKAFQIDYSSGDYDTAAKRDTIHDPGARIGAVGDQWFDFGTWVNTTSVALDNGESEIWISNLSGVVATYNVWYSMSTCYLIEADIRVNSDYSWISSDGGYSYYDPGSYYYFRHTHMHELLHVVGLNHDNSEFTYLSSDYGAKTLFTNRSSSWRVEPLPDARTGLRDLYESSGSETDLAVANLWSDGSTMEYLCKPAEGSGWSSSQFDTYCATSPVINQACNGDSVYVRYAAMNYGTASKSMTIEFFFSTDRSYGSDTKSSTTQTYTLGAGDSVRLGKIISVPAGLSSSTSYYILTRIVPHGGEESTQNNWIPLRGQITTASSC